MNEPTMGNLAQRLERLERENRRLKWVGSLMLVGIAGLLMMGQSQCNLSKTVEAQRFIIRDAEGKARAELSQSGLWFTDSNESARVALGVAGGLQLRGTDGSQISIVTPWMAGPYEPFLSIIDKGSTSVAKLEPTSLSLLHDGKQRVSLGVDIKDTLIDKEGRAVPISRGNVATLTLSDKEGNVRLTLGGTQLKTIKTGTVEQKLESSVVLFDKDGKVAWRAP